MDIYAKPVFSENRSMMLVISPNCETIIMDVMRIKVLIDLIDARHQLSFRCFESGYPFE